MVYAPNGGRTRRGVAGGLLLKAERGSGHPSPGSRYPKKWGQKINLEHFTDRKRKLGSRVRRLRGWGVFNA